MTLAKRLLTITQGNVNNHHLYLTEVMDLFPPDAIGGHNRKVAAPRRVRVLWGGKPVETDIVADKHIFRRRQWVGQFFEANRIVPGDRVLLEQMEPYLYRVSKLVPELEQTVPDREKSTPREEVSPTEPGCAVCACSLGESRRSILSRGLGGANWLKVPVVVCCGCFSLLGQTRGDSRDRQCRSMVGAAVSFWFRCA